LDNLEDYLNIVDIAAIYEASGLELNKISKKKSKNIKLEIKQAGFLPCIKTSKINFSINFSCNKIIKIF
jgi:hypothetical protein